MQRQRDALRAELAECRAELEKWRTHNAWLVDNSVKKGQEAEAAEARAERYRELVARAWPIAMKHEATRPCLEWLRDAGTALAETEKEKP